MHIHRRTCVAINVRPGAAGAHCAEEGGGPVDPEVAEATPAGDKRRAEGAGRVHARPADRPAAKRAEGDGPADGDARHQPALLRADRDAEDDEDEEETEDDLKSEGPQDGVGVRLAGRLSVWIRKQPVRIYGTPGEWRNERPILLRRRYRGTIIGCCERQREQRS